MKKKLLLLALFTIGMGITLYGAKEWKAQDFTHKTKGMLPAYVKPTLDALNVLDKEVDDALKETTKADRVDALKEALEKANKASAKVDKIAGSGRNQGNLANLMKHKNQQIRGIGLKIQEGLIKIADKVKDIKEKIFADSEIWDEIVKTGSGEIGEKLTELGKKMDSFVAGNIDIKDPKTKKVSFDRLNDEQVKELGLDTLVETTKVPEKIAMIETMKKEFDDKKLDQHLDSNLKKAAEQIKDLQEKIIKAVEKDTKKPFYHADEKKVKEITEKALKVWDKKHAAKKSPAVTAAQKAIAEIKGLTDITDINKAYNTAKKAVTTGSTDETNLDNAYKARKDELDAATQAPTDIADATKVKIADVKKIKLKEDSSAGKYYYTPVGKSEVLISKTQYENIEKAVNKRLTEDAILSVQEAILAAKKVGDLASYTDYVKSNKVIDQADNNEYTLLTKQKDQLKALFEAQKAYLENQDKVKEYNDELTELQKIKNDKNYKSADPTIQAAALKLSKILFDSKAITVKDTGTDGKLEAEIAKLEKLVADAETILKNADHTKPDPTDATKLADATTKLEEVEQTKYRMITNKIDGIIADAKKEVKTIKDGVKVTPPSTSGVTELTTAIKDLTFFADNFAEINALLTADASKAAVKQTIAGDDYELKDTTKQKLLGDHLAGLGANDASTIDKKFYNDKKTDIDDLVNAAKTKTPAFAKIDSDIYMLENTQKLTKLEGNILDFKKASVTKSDAQQFIDLISDKTKFEAEFDADNRKFALAFIKVTLKNRANQLDEKKGGLLLLPSKNDILKTSTDFKTLKTKAEGTDITDFTTFKDTELSNLKTAISKISWKY